MAYKDPNDPRLKAARRKHYYKNKGQYIANNLKKKERIIKYIRSVKDVPCTDCGIKYPYYVMEFDHLDPSKKEYGVAKLVSCGSWTKVKREIAKCEVVCSNCHRIRTYGSPCPKVANESPKLVG